MRCSRHPKDVDLAIVRFEYMVLLELQIAEEEHAKKQLSSHEVMSYPKP